MKITVYAICKNEEKFVNRWFNSMKEADEICVLDTGSTDNTVKLLKKLGIKVKSKKISPWRFDKARNLSLEMISNDTDICICTDLDEIFMPNWRNQLESAWQNNTTRCRYTYNWSLDENNKPLVSFFSDKIHSLKNYRWINPVHEILKYDGEENIITIPDLTINHYPDNTKSRSSYLPLLELAVKEDPNNDRNMHYLGREYMYYGKYQEAIDTLIKHLNLPSAVWKEERSASMRFIGRCYKNIKRFEEAKMWYEKAIKETPHLRDPYVELSFLYYDINDWPKLKQYLEEALEIKIKEKIYINEVFSWDDTIYDLLSICYFNQKNYIKALEYINQAITIKPNDERLLNNKKIIEEKIQ